jgi:WD40 repeat protein
MVMRLAFCLLAAAGLVAVPRLAPAQEPASPASPKWEYKAVFLSNDEKETTKKLNELAKDGWEYVGLLHSSLVAFRRPAAAAVVEKVSQVRLFGEHKNFFTARFSPDGRLAVSAGGGELTLDTNEWVAGSDFDVRIWDMKTGKELRRLKHDAGVFAVCSPDSKQVLTISGKTIRVWEADTGKEVAKHTYDFTLGWAAWSPDGKSWFIACGDKNVRLFDAASGKELRTFSGHTHENIESVAFARDGKRACSSGFDGTVRVWEIATGKELAVIQGSDGFRVRQAVWSPDGRYLLCGGANNMVQLFDAEKGEEVRRFEGHTGYVESVSFSPDGRRALSASIDGTIRLWDVKTGKELHRFEDFQVKDRHKTIVHIVFSPDGRHALSSGWDKTLRLWRLPN